MTLITRWEKPQLKAFPGSQHLHNNHLLRGILPREIHHFFSGVSLPQITCHFIILIWSAGRGVLGICKFLDWKLEKSDLKFNKFLENIESLWSPVNDPVQGYTEFFLCSHLPIPYCSRSRFSLQVKSQISSPPARGSHGAGPHTAPHLGVHALAPPSAWKLFLIH